MKFDFRMMLATSASRLLEKGLIVSGHALRASTVSLGGARLA
jgi:hypothetical protein